MELGVWEVFALLGAVFFGICCSHWAWGLELLLCNYKGSADFYSPYRGLGKYCCPHLGYFQASKENKECFVLPHVCMAGGREAATMGTCDAIKHLAI